jgi:microsomal epoxide hydrolase
MLDLCAGGVMDTEPHVVPRVDRADPHASEIRRVRPFHVRVDPSVLDDLQRRLARTRWTERPELDWRHGTDPEYLRALIEHWRSGYDWRREEAALDRLPQYVADFDQTSLHFVHLPSAAPTTIPLLLLHGWPDSFHRYHAVAPILASAGFDVVIPSLPGFAFTPALRPAPAAQPLRHVARLLRDLMVDVLGYPRFGVVGGDTGGAIAQILAIDDPDRVVGVHLTELGWHATTTTASLSWSERRYVRRVKQRFAKDGAYAMVQTTQPRSLAASLADSPVGLASWIVDRFHAWSDGDLDARFGKDALLTNIMLYWITQSIGSSIFTYFAESRSPSLTPEDRVEVPVGLALFPRDSGGVPPRRFAERTLAISHWTEMPRGGHFAALEEPELFARDVLAFFLSLGH